MSLLREGPNVCAKVKPPCCDVLADLHAVAARENVIDDSFAVKERFLENYGK